MIIRFTWNCFIAFDSVPRFLVFDRDAKYGLEVPAAVRSLNMSPRSDFLPKSLAEWNRGWVGSCRRELLDHVIAFNERHLKRLLCEYISYHHEERTHLGLGKGTPGGRTTPYLPVAYGHSRDWAGCTIATIGLPDLISKSRCEKLDRIIPS